MTRDGRNASRDDWIAPSHRQNIHNNVRITEFYYQLLLSQSNYQPGIPKFGQPRHARKHTRMQAHTHARARSTYATLPALWVIVSPIFGFTIARGSGGQVRAATPSTSHPFLFSLEREVMWPHGVETQPQASKFEPSGIYVWCGVCVRVRPRPLCAFDAS